MPGGMSGNDGLNGMAGRASPGQSGTITVRVDPAAQHYVSLLRLSNRSGNGSRGPTQQLRAEPVAPLW